LKRLKNPWETTQEMVKSRDKTVFLPCKKNKNTEISLNNFLITNGPIVKIKTPSIPWHFFFQLRAKEWFDCRIRRIHTTTKNTNSLEFWLIRLLKKSRSYRGVLQKSSCFRFLQRVLSEWNCVILKVRTWVLVM